jgi:hypothetical protein
MMGFLNKAQQPVYGKAQQAQYLGQLNKLAEGSIESLRSNLARMGGLDSGLMGLGVSNIANERLGKMSDFYSQLPFMERQAQMQNLGNALGMATGWAGRAPISQFTSDSGTESTNQKTTQQGSQMQQGPSWWKGALTGLGGIGGSIFGDWLGSGGMGWGDDFNYDRTTL